MSTTEITSKVGRFQARPKRTPLHEQRDRLTVQGRDSERVYRWVNDVEDRILKFKEGGYRVEQKEGIVVGDPAIESGIDQTSSIVTKHVGGKIKAVLMSIQKDWYDEDQLAKQKQIDATDSAMRANAEGASDYGTLTISKRRRG